MAVVAVMVALYVVELAEIVHCTVAGPEIVVMHSTIKPQRANPTTTQCALHGGPLIRHVLVR